MRTLLLIFVVLSVQVGNATECTQAKLQSTDPKTGVVTTANGFAIESNIIATNDHAIAQDATTVTVTFDNRDIQGKVVARDFHTDLALISISSKMSKCELGSGELSNLQQIVIKAYDAKDDKVSEIFGRVKSSSSQRMEVPGITSAIEVVGENQGLAVRKSLSGGLLVHDGKVVGLLTQKTQEGTGLAIKAEQLKEVAGQLKAGTLIKRNYNYDYREQKAYFNGLEISKNRPHDGKGGHPHDGKGGHPHDGKGNQPIALEDYQLGYAVATVTSLKALRLHQKDLADLLAQSKSTKIYISSIDGMKVTGFFSLLRALVACSVCQIDNYWLEATDPGNFGDQFHQAQGFVTQLMLSLEKRHGPAFVHALKPLFEQFNTRLVKMYHESKAGVKNLRTQNELLSIWETIEGHLKDKWHSEETLDALTEIRNRLPVN